MKNSILILLLIAALGPSCIKEIQIPFIPVPKMKSCPWPAISTEGNTTMGFKVNRQNWVPCVSLNFYGIQGVEGSLRESDGSNRLWLRGFYSINGVDTSSTLDIKLSPLKTGLIRLPGAGNRLDGDLSKLNERSITVLQDKTQPALEIPVTDIDRLRFKEKGSVRRGLLYGALIGFGAGFVFGVATAGSSSCTPGSAFCVQVSPLAVGLFSGLLACGAGMVIGGAVGSFRTGVPINGRQDEYERQRQLLEQYRFQDK